MEQQLIHNLKETEQLAKTIASNLKGGEVIGLVGELGAGKTTLVQFLAKALGIKEMVNSPTFVLMKIYKIKIQDTSSKVQKNSKFQNTNIKQLIHVDAYRLNGSEELRNIGLQEYLGRKDTVVVIEWADKIRDLLPVDATIINIKESKEGNQRIIEIS